MDREERDGLRALCDKATPGPWYFYQGTDYRECLDKPLHWWIVRSSADGCSRFQLQTLGHDANDEYANRRWPEILGFVVAARNDMPALLDALDAAEARAEKAEAALARERRVSEELAFQIANCPLDAGCDVPDKCACLKDTCEAHEEPPDRRRQIESGCWRAWAESEADKEVPHEP